MTANPTNYHRLPGTGSSIASRSTLWLGDDHVLAINSTGFSEDYRRFYFRDIQAVIIRKTDNGKITNLVLLSLAVPTILGAFVAGQGAWQGFWIVLTFVLLVILGINSIFGPTAKCHLRTAVQMEELPSLRRLRRARKVLDRLRPLIVEAQGQLAPEELAARMAETGGTSSPSDGDSPAQPAGPAPSQPLPPEAAPPAAS